jgi:hypothetical protein
MIKDLPYNELPMPPTKMSATTVLVRLIDGIGFRYRWATEGLCQQDLLFQPCTSSKKIGELLEHIQRLLMVSESYITDRELEEIKPLGFEERRMLTFEIILRIREALLGIDDVHLSERTYKLPWSKDKMPIWYLINGPLSDVLTHIGQIASWRRINNNPIQGASVFFGKPPH